MVSLADADIMLPEQATTFFAGWLAAAGWLMSDE
jgi:hypothetical protein